MGVGGWFDGEGRALPKWAMRRSLRVVEGCWASSAPVRSTLRPPCSFRRLLSSSQLSLRRATRCRRSAASCNGQRQITGAGPCPRSQVLVEHRLWRQTGWQCLHSSPEGQRFLLLPKLRCRCCSTGLRASSPGRLVDKASGGSHSSSGLPRDLPEGRDRALRPLLSPPCRGGKPSHVNRL